MYVGIAFSGETHFQMLMEAVKWVLWAKCHVFFILTGSTPVKLFSGHNFLFRKQKFWKSCLSLTTFYSLTTICSKLSQTLPANFIFIPFSCACTTISSLTSFPAPSNFEVQSCFVFPAIKTFEFFYTLWEGLGFQGSQFVATTPELWRRLECFPARSLTFEFNLYCSNQPNPKRQ